VRAVTHSAASFSEKRWVNAVWNLKIGKITAAFEHFPCERTWGKGGDPGKGGNGSLVSLVRSKWGKEGNNGPCLGASGGIGDMNHGVRDGSPIGERPWGKE